MSEGYCPDCGTPIGISGHCTYCAFKAATEGQQSGIPLFNDRYVLVSLCVNGNNGEFTGRVLKIDIADADFETLSCIESRSVFEEEGGEAIQIETAFIVIGNRHYDTRPNSRGRWVGNMAWDSVDMELETARRLIRDLVASGDWSEEVGNWGK